MSRSAIRSTHAIEERTRGSRWHLVDTASKEVMHDKAWKKRRQG